MAGAGIAAAVYTVPCRARRAAPRSAPRAGRRGVPHAARALSRRPEPGFDATYHVRLGDIGPHLGGALHDARRARAPGRARAASPTSSIGTDAETWLPLREGELSGVEAFWQRLLYARGDLDLAVGFEGMFRLPNGRPPLLRIHDVALPGRRVSTLTMGEGPDVLLLHGLGATKASFFDTAGRAQRAATASTRSTCRASAARPSPLRSVRRALVRRHGGRRDGRARDRPRPPRRQLDGRPRRDRGRAARARARRRPRAAVPGGRLRPARLAPGRAPAAPRARAAAPPPRARPGRPPVLEPVRRPRPGRPERGRHRGRRVPAHLRARRRAAGLPHRGAQHLPRASVRARRLLPAAGRARGARAVRVGRLRPADPAGLQRHVAEWLPDAEQIVLEDCGHVPQVERPEQTNGLLRRFFARIDALGPRRARARAA